MASDREDAAGGSGDEAHRPTGTIFLMIVFLLLLIGTWVYTYSVLLSRG